MNDNKYSHILKFYPNIANKFQETSGKCNFNMRHKFTMKIKKSPKAKINHVPGGKISY